MGNSRGFWEPKFKCSETTIEMSQKQYIDKVLSKFQMTDSKPKSTPCALGVEKESDVEPRELSDPQVVPGNCWKPNIYNDRY